MISINIILLNIEILPHRKQFSSKTVFPRGLLISFFIYKFIHY